MDLYLVTPDNTSYNIRYDGSGYFTLAETLPDGIGYPPVDHLMTLSAYRDGGRLNAIRYRPRVVDVTVITHANSVDTLMTALKRVYTASKPSKIALVPSKIKAVANNKTAYLDVYYTGEVVRQRYNGREAEVTLRFVAYNPLWYYSSLNTQALTLNGTLSVYRITQRKVAGNSVVWDSMSSGVNGLVRALAVAPDGTLYAGGYFTTAGGVGANRIARWNGTSWSALGAGTNNAVLSLAVAPDGTLYAGGTFAAAGGVGANYIARWNGSSWSALGLGMNSEVDALAVAPDGTLYAGGLFTTAGGISANYVAKWDGSSWSALGTGTNNAVLSLAVAPDGTLYAGGYFTTAGNNTVNYIARWNGSSWSPLGTGTNSIVRALAVAPDGTLYAGGYFTTAGGVNANYIARWNGSSWSALGTGTNDGVLSLAIAPDGTLYAGGTFTTAGGKPTNGGIALWNGYRWLSVDASIPGTPSVYAIVSQPLAIGFDASFTATCGYTTSITNSGSPVKPVIEVNGKCTLRSLFNETTGKRLWFDVTLQAGEKLTIDCDKLTITSSWRGNLLSALVPGSNFADFVLQPGVNNITVFATNTSGANASIKWYNRYDTLAEAVG